MLVTLRGKMVGLVKWFKNPHKSRSCDYYPEKYCSAKNWTIEGAGIATTTSDNILGCCKSNKMLRNLSNIVCKNEG